MESETNRTIDQQCRIALPYKLLQKFGWGTGDELSVCTSKGALVLSIARRYEGPRCVICNKLEQKVCIGGADICGSCVQEILTASAS